MTRQVLSDRYKGSEIARQTVVGGRRGREVGGGGGEGGGGGRRQEAGSVGKGVLEGTLVSPRKGCQGRGRVCEGEGGG